MDHLFEVTDEAFEREVQQADAPVVLEFWAPSCGAVRRKMSSSPARTSRVRPHRTVRSNK
jgi:hypothetical protein